MGLSPCPSTADGGILFVIFANIITSFSILKGLVRSLLHSVGIGVSSVEDHSRNEIYINHTMSNSVIIRTPLESPITIVKGLVLLLLHSVGIGVSSDDDYTRRNEIYIDHTLPTFLFLRAPSESYVEEFRVKTPTVRYDTVCDTIHGNPQPPPPQECVVCLTEFVADDEINLLPCGHFFHKSCVEKWLNSWKFTCPLCRNYMILRQEQDQDLMLSDDEVDETDEANARRLPWNEC